MTDIHPTVADVTDRIRDRIRESRSAYLDRVDRAAGEGPNRLHLACTNLAHGFAACGADNKAELGGGDGPNIGIVTSYNDMLSAHEPLGAFPQIIKRACREAGAVAQVAGDRTVARHVRRCALPWRLRQDRPGAVHRRRRLRSSSGDIRARGADAVGPA